MLLFIQASGRTAICLFEGTLKVLVVLVHPRTRDPAISSSCHSFVLSDALFLKSPH